jgi:hypothetical protein
MVVNGHMLLLAVFMSALTGTLDDLGDIHSAAASLYLWLLSRLDCPIQLQVSIEHGHASKANILVIPATLSI